MVYSHYSFRTQNKGLGSFDQIDISYSSHLGHNLSISLPPSFVNNQVDPTQRGVFLDKNIWALYRRPYLVLFCPNPANSPMGPT